jgi:CubicO group peptidase (beta-lactamase class C family)
MTMMISKVKIWLMALASLLVLLPFASFAQQKNPTIPLAKSDLEPWLDGFMLNALRANQVQGVVVVVVKDGEILLQKGYGYADAGNRIPIDPEKTLFRPGSISKLFAWTSIMQLVEQGKINLDADINDYLDFKIIGKDGEKITVRNLMTHRAGFEELGKSGLFSDPAQLEPLGTFLKDHVPRRIFTPGSTPAYSNYGASLAGYIVQRVSGMPFETYVERNIFDPLGMKYSTFRQPLPTALQPFMSLGYDLAGEKPKPFELLNDVPAGALTSSAADMARFMIAHLEAERASSGKLLRPETARLMHRQVIKNFPALNGMALGFYENDMSSRKMIAHGGDLALFHSNLSLFMDDRIGIYISLNSAGNNAFSIRAELLRQFVDRYMPRLPATGSIDSKLAQSHLAQVSGAYLATRRLESSFASLGNLISEVTLSSDDDGLLVLTGGPKPMRFREIRPYLWEEVDGQQLLTVKMKDDKPVAMALNSIAPIWEYTPVAPLLSASTLIPAFLAAFSVLILSLLAWPVGALMRKSYGVALTRSIEEKRVLFVRRVASISFVVSVVAWSALIIPRVDGFTDADNAQILVTQSISILSTLVAVVAFLLTALNSLNVHKTIWQKVGPAIWMVSILFLVWFYFNFNLLKFGADL